MRKLRKQANGPTAMMAEQNQGSHEKHEKSQKEFRETIRTPDGFRMFFFVPFCVFCGY
jgi:hypothetical protein